MRRRGVTLLLAAVLAAGAGTTVGAAATPTVLFVDNVLGACSDTGSGTAAQPFCSIQAAADVALPGQTVHVAAGQYFGPVDITRSGAPGNPIRFEGVPQPGTATQRTIVNGRGGPGLHVSHADDVVITGIEVTGSAPGVSVSDSSRVAIEDDFLNGAAQRGDGVDVDGRSSDVTVSRSVIVDYLGGGIDIGPGADGTTVTTNIITRNSGPGVATVDAPGTVVTSNSVLRNCTAGISLGGASTGATVENNVLDSDDNTAVGASPCATVAFLAELAVSTGSVDGTTADYNLVNGDLAHLYSWAGTSFTSPAALTKATGQGSHDINALPQFTDPATAALGSTSPAIDSANSAAPGELTVDQAGHPRVDDALRPNTGVGEADRGAFEVQDPFRLGALSVSPTQGPTPLPVTATVAVSNPWSTDVTYTFDFGDGTPAVTTKARTATHTYTDVRTADVTVTATIPNGVRVSPPVAVQVTAPAPLVPASHVFQVGALSVEADDTASTDSWQITDYAIDFGDGSPVQHTGSGRALHSYAQPGTYTVTTTETDFAGNTATVSRVFTVGSVYFAVPAQRVLDTTDGTGGVPVGPIGANGVVSLPLVGTHGIPGTGVRAVVLNVTALNPTAAGALTVYPDLTARPGTPNIHYTAGRSVSNLVTVPVGANGAVAFHNRKGAVDVAADLEGYYVDRPAFNGGGLLTAVRSQRLLDTRDTTSTTHGAPLGPGDIVQVPVDRLNRSRTPIQAVVLHVTAIAPTKNGFLTVYDDGTPRPGVPTLDLTQGQETSNLVTVPASSGTVDIANDTGSVDVTVDVEAYYTQPVVLQPDLGGAPFTPAQPIRLLDTRTDVGGHPGPLGPGEVATLKVSNTAGVPADATSVVLNVTAVAPTRRTSVTVHPAGTARPDASALDANANQTVANLVVVPIGANREIDFFNQKGQVNLVADLEGYFTG